MMSLAELLEPTPTAAVEQRILVVDDDPQMREFLHDVLHAAGFVVDCAEDGVAALGYIERCMPDLIISDLRMPRLGGINLLQRIRDNAGSSIPFIMLSGSGTSSDRVISIDCGANDCLVKPIDSEELLARVRQQIRHARQIQHLREQSYVDSLTRVHNRRAALATLHREIERCGRKANSLGVLLIDLDNFKSINDTYGHAVGDEVLVDVAQAISSAVRASDVVGRLGGDEFMVVLPEVSDRVTRQIIERIRARVAKVQVANVGVYASCSIGAAVHSEHDRCADINELIEAADAAMYDDKRQHRAPDKERHLRAL